MESQSVISRLLDVGIFEEGTNEEDLQLSEEFQEKLDEHHQQIGGLTKKELKEQLREQGKEEYIVRLADESPEICTLYLVLEEYLPMLPRDTLIDIVCVLDQLNNDSIPTEGSPDSFLPIHGERLPALMELQRRAIVYIWREECPPCDGMKARFNDILEATPQDIALFSVYGPETPELLFERYAVEGGPTTLFFADGQVDARLIGLHHPEVIENEIDKLREVTEIR